MKDDELERVLGSLDDALAVMRKNEGSLEVADIRIQSVLAALRHEIALYRAVARTAERTNKETS
jgi:hypothetical protein